MPGRKPMLWKLLALALLMLVGGCATNSPPPVLVPAPSPAIPPLPAEARQPKPPIECLPTCSEGLMRLRKELLRTLQQLHSPAKPANAPTTR